MSETKPTPQALDPDFAEKIAGGAFDMCSPDQIKDLISQMQTNYENLIDLASYVIDRVAGGPPAGP